MKNTLEYLNQLPEPYRTKAIDNATCDDLVKPQKDLVCAIINSFDFTSSPEGENYWWNLVEGIVEQQKLIP